MKTKEMGLVIWTFSALQALALIFEFVAAKVLQFTGLLQAIDGLYPKSEFWVVFLISRFILLLVLYGLLAQMWKFGIRNNIASTVYRPDLKINITKLQTGILLGMGTLYAMYGIEVMIRFCTQTSFPVQ